MKSKLFSGGVIWGIAISTVIFCAPNVGWAEQASDAEVTRVWEQELVVRLGDADVTLTEEGREELRGFLDGARSALRKNPARAKKQGLKNLGVLESALRDQSEPGSDGSPRRLSRKAVQNGLRGLCPLYPFCR